MSIVDQTRIDKRTFPLARASRLLPEILAHIFLDSARTHYHEHSDYTGIPHWVNFSYVCRDWRNAALYCAPLWGYLFVVSPFWTEVAITRSKEAPLWVHCCSPPNQKIALQFMEQVWARAERLRGLRLHLQPSDAQTVFFKFVLSSTTRPHLSQLQYFSISAPLSSLACFLPRIYIPATTRVKLGCLLEPHRNVDKYAPFYAFLAARFDNPTTSTPIRTMVIADWAQRTSIVFSASEHKCIHRIRDSSIFHGCDCDCDVPLEVEINWMGTTSEDENLVAGICRSVPLARLKNLTLDRCGLRSERSNIFWHLSELRHIELYKNDLSDILGPLTLTPPINQQNVGLPFAPSLEELSLNEVTVCRNCEGFTTIHGWRVTWLYEVLQQRKAAGHVLKLLVINGNRVFSQKEVVRLGEAVEQVEMNESSEFWLPDQQRCQDCRKLLADSL